MAVYVDDADIRATVGRYTSRWCHLTADTEEELHEFAARIGLRRAWFQNEGKPTYHYDVTTGVRRRAVLAGAQEITWRQMGEMVMARRAAERQGPEPVAPATADEQEAAGRQLSEEAGRAWRAGEPVQAARLMLQAREADPDHAAEWDEHLAWMRTHTADLPLDIATQTRLALAGIQPDDPGLEQVSEWNAQAARNAGHVTQPEPETAQQEPGQ